MKEWIQTPGGIHFNAEKHIYLNDDGEQYVSGTAFVGSFKPKFDSDFWSQLKVYESYFVDLELNNDQLNKISNWYSAIGRRLPRDLNTWVYVKKYLQVYDNEKDIKNKTLELAKEIASLNNIDVDLKSNTKEMLKSWKGKAKQATDKGTLYHDREENKIKRSYGHPDDWSGFNIQHPFLTRNPYAELRLYNHKYKLSGSADYIKILNKKGRFTMIDYKTSKEVSQYVYTNPWTGKSDNMLDPIDKLGNCNYNHYMLQLSLYAWMMEELGYSVDSLYILHVVVDENGYIIEDSLGNPQKEYIKVHYAKKAILKMLDHYEKNYLNN